jgi:hypothetical protein
MTTLTAVTTPAPAGAPPAPAADLAGYLNEVNALPDEVILGAQVWYRIAEPELVTRDMLERWFAELELDPVFLPPRLRTIDAFEKACAQTKHTAPLGPAGQYTSTLRFERVSADPNRVIYHLVRQITDAKRIALHFSPKIAEAIFYRGKGAVLGSGERLRTTVNLSGGDNQLTQDEIGIVEDLLGQLTDRYQRHARYYHGDKLRTMVRTYITSSRLNAVLLNKSGGLYFAHKAHNAELAALATLVGRLGGSSQLVLMPFLDLPSLRALVIEQFQTETREQLEQLSATMGELLTSGKPITVEQATRCKLIYDDVMSRAEEYTESLDTALEDTADALELVRAQLGRLANSIAEAS